jgi:hypothetical protein
MSNATHETAPTEFVQVGGVRFAYRRFGRLGDLPLLLLNHLAADGRVIHDAGGSQVEELASRDPGRLGPPGDEGVGVRA